MATFSIPKSPSRNVINVDKFLGADFTSAATDVSPYMSPSTINMIRDVPGKVRKRKGFKFVKHYGYGSNVVPTNNYYPIYNMFPLDSEHYLINAGTTLVNESGTTVFSSYDETERTESYIFNGKSYIIGFEEFIVYNGSSVVPVSSVAYIPTITIGKSPNGGGTSYEPFNLIGKGFTESFLGNGTATFYLSLNGLDSDTVIVKKLASNGDWTSLYENVDFNVDRQNGIVYFNSPIESSPVTGEDNLKITAYKTISGYADRINKCKFGICYGVNGSHDRLFLSGNPDYPNQDWFSGYNDPTYFPDTNYGIIGSSYSKIVGYSIVNNLLATHKDDLEKDYNVVLRQGVMADATAQPTFNMVGSFPAPGAISNKAFGYLNSEPLYLTERGVYAITTPDSGERYVQDRSYYLNGSMIQDLQNDSSYVCSCVYNDMFLVKIGADNHIYVLDGLQSMKEENEPYSTRQYAGFYLEAPFKFRIDAVPNPIYVNATISSMWVYNNKLYVGTIYGDVLELKEDADSINTYVDELNNDTTRKVENTIYAKWETPMFDGTLFYKKKTFRHLALRLKSAIYSSVKIYAQDKGIWEYMSENSETRETWDLITEDNVSAKYFSFTNLVFSKLSFSTDTTSKVIPVKIKIKKVDKAAFRFENDSEREPFGIDNYALEYVESGNVK